MNSAVLISHTLSAQGYELDAYTTRGQSDDRIDRVRRTYRARGAHSTTTLRVARGVFMVSQAEWLRRNTSGA